MKVGVVGFLIVVVASVFLWHPTTTDSTGKVTRQESLIERIGTGSIKEMEKPAPFFKNQTPEQKAETKAKLKKSSEEFERLKKLSKPIPMKLVSGKMPLIVMVSNPPGGWVKRGITYASKYPISITHITTNMSCGCPDKISSPPFGWALSISNEGKKYKFVTAGVGCSSLDMDVCIKAKFVRIDLSVNVGAQQPVGDYLTRISDFKIEGVPLK